MASWREARHKSQWIEHWNARALITVGDDAIGISLGSEEIGRCSDEATVDGILQAHGISGESGWCTVEESIAAGYYWNKGSQYWQANGLEEPSS